MKIRVEIDCVGGKVSTELEIEDSLLIILPLEVSPVEFIINELRPCIEKMLKQGEP